VIKTFFHLCNIYKLSEESYKGLFNFRNYHISQQCAYIITCQLLQQILNVRYLATHIV